MNIKVIEVNQPSQKAIENTARAIKRVFDKWEIEDLKSKMLKCGAEPY